jgi:hypothetical protein
MSEEIVLAPMTADEARRATDKIKSNQAESRQLLLDVYERDGWKVLGYKNIEQYAKDELDYSKPYSYRLIDAAQIERNLRKSPIGDFRRAIVEIPESQLRPLAALTADVQPVVYQKAVETAPNGKVTAAHVAQAVKDYNKAEQPVTAKVAEPEPEVTKQGVEDTTEEDKELQRIGYFFKLYQEGSALYEKWFDAELPATRRNLREQLHNLMVKIDQERNAYA